jgi:hypothetical protein
MSASIKASMALAIARRFNQDVVLQARREALKPGTPSCIRCVHLASLLWTGPQPGRLWMAGRGGGDAAPEVWSLGSEEKSLGVMGGNKDFSLKPSKHHFSLSISLFSHKKYALGRDSLPIFPRSKGSASDGAPIQIMFR